MPPLVNSSSCVFVTCLSKLQIKNRRNFSKKNFSNEKMRSILITVVCLFFAKSGLCGSCKESKLCCEGRDSSCVVQKAPLNTIIEDLSDKPCYCDHACIKLGDCCHDFKEACGGTFNIYLSYINLPDCIQNFSGCISNFMFYKFYDYFYLYLLFIFSFTKNDKGWY